MRVWNAEMLFGFARTWTLTSAGCCSHQAAFTRSANGVRLQAGLSPALMQMVARRRRTACDARGHADSRRLGSGHRQAARCGCEPARRSSGTRPQAVHVLSALEVLAT